MAIYRRPLDDSNLFNERNYISNNEIIGSSSNENINIDLTKYLKIDGSNSMSGIFNTPTIQLFGESSKIIFQDGTELKSIYDIEDSGTVDEARIVDITHNMTTLTTTIANNCFINNLTAGAFTLDNKNVRSELDKISKISYDPTNFLTTIDNNTYVESLSVGNFNTTHLANTSSNIQNQINNNVSSINNNTTKLTNVSFNNNLTTISNDTHINNLTAGNFNTRHLEDIIMNVQPQLDKLVNITYSLNNNLTSISNNIYINNLNCGNFTTSHLSNTTSNIQTQINNLRAQVFAVFYDKQYSNFNYTTEQPEAPDLAYGVSYNSNNNPEGGSLLGITDTSSQNTTNIPSHNMGNGRIVMNQTSYYDNNGKNGITLKPNKFYKIHCDLRLRPFERSGNKSISIKFLSAQIYLTDTIQMNIDPNTARIKTDEKIIIDYSNINMDNVVKTFNFVDNFESILFTNELINTYTFTKATIVLRYSGIVSNDGQDRIKIISNLSIIEL